MLEVLKPWFHRFIFTRFIDNPRAADPFSLAEVCRALPFASTSQRHDEVNGGQEELFVATNPEEAWELIHQTVGPNEVIVIAGSFFTAAEFRRLVSSRPLTGARSAKPGWGSPLAQDSGPELAT